MTVPHLYSPPPISLSRDKSFVASSEPPRVPPHNSPRLAPPHWRAHRGELRLARAPPHLCKWRRVGGSRECPLVLRCTPTRAIWDAPAWGAIVLRLHLVPAHHAGALHVCCAVLHRGIESTDITLGGGYRYLLAIRRFCALRPIRPVFSLLAVGCCDSAAHNHATQK